MLARSQRDDGYGAIESNHMLVGDTHHHQNHHGSERHRSLPPSPDDETFASIPNEIANISKNLIGSGLLSLSGGIADFSDDPTSAIVSSTIIIFAMALLLGYFAMLIAAVCEETKAKNFKDCWERSVGQKYNGASSMVALVNALAAGIGNLAYATVLSQTLQSLLLSLGLPVTRVASLVLIVVLVLWPICRMRNLYRLAPFSILGVSVMVVTVLAMLIRSLDGTYSPPDGKFYLQIDPRLRPSFGNETRLFSLRILPLISMLFQAYIMHYNAPRFYAELSHASIPRFRTAMIWSFGTAALLYAVATGAGFFTFGKNCASLILNNYAVTDPLATLGRIAVLGSTVLIFPLSFLGFRDGVMSVFGWRDGDTELVTAALLAIITSLACVISDLGIINAFAGGVLGAVIGIIIPAVMYVHIIDSRVEQTFVVALASVGTVAGVVGAMVAFS